MFPSPWTYFWLLLPCFQVLPLFFKLTCFGVSVDCLNLKPFHASWRTPIHCQPFPSPTTLFTQFYSVVTAFDYFLLLLAIFSSLHVLASSYCRLLLVIFECFWTGFGFFDTVWMCLHPFGRFLNCFRFLLSIFNCFHILHLFSTCLWPADHSGIAEALRLQCPTTMTSW